jgi:hypothetical protein
MLTRCPPSALQEEPWRSFLSDSVEPRDGMWLWGFGDLKTFNDLIRSRTRCLATDLSALLPVKCYTLLSVLQQDAS